MLKKLFFLLIFSFGLSAFNWSSALNISSNELNADSGEVVIDPLSNELIAIWSTYGSFGKYIQYSYSSNSMQNWSSICSLTQASQMADSPCIAITNSGKAIVVFRSFDGNNYRITERHSLDNFGSFSEPVYLSSAGEPAQFPQLALTSGGDAVVVWNRFDGTNYRIQLVKSSNSFGNWSGISNISQAGFNSQNPQIIINDADDAIVVWKMFNNYNYVLQESHSFDIQNFTDPKLITQTGQDVKDFNIKKNGNEIVAVYSRLNGNNFIIYETHSSDNLGSFSDPLSLSTESYDASEPDLVCINGNAVVVWNQFNGETNVIQEKHSSNNFSTWSDTVDISNLTLNSSQPKICIYNNTEALICWIEKDGYQYNIINESHSTNSLNDWFLPSCLSCLGKNSFDLRLISNTTGTVIPSWFLYNNVNFIYQLRFSY